LSVDEPFAPFVCHYTDQPVKLQHFSINYGDIPACGRDHDPLTALPGFNQLKQLGTLKVEVPERCRDALARCMAKCRETLESCYVGGWAKTACAFACFLESTRPFQTT